MKKRVHADIDSEILDKALFVLREIGLTPHDAIRTLFHKIARDGAFPAVLLETSTEDQKIKSIDDLVGKDVL